MQLRMHSEQPDSILDITFYVMDEIDGTAYELTAFAGEACAYINSEYAKWQRNRLHLLLEKHAPVDGWKPVSLRIYGATVQNITWQVTCNLSLATDVPVDELNALCQTQEDRITARVQSIAASKAPASMKRPRLTNGVGLPPSTLVAATGSSF